MWIESRDQKVTSHGCGSRQCISLKCTLLLHISLNGGIYPACICRHPVISHKNRFLPNFLGDGILIREEHLSSLNWNIKFLKIWTHFTMRLFILFWTHLFILFFVYWVCEPDYQIVSITVSEQMISSWSSLLHRKFLKGAKQLFYRKMRSDQAMQYYNTDVTLMSNGAVYAQVIHVNNVRCECLQQFHIYFLGNGR